MREYQSPSETILVFLKNFRCKEIELDRNKLSYERDQIVQTKTRQLQTEKNNLELEISNSREKESRLYDEFEQKLAAKQREIEILQDKVECIKTDGSIERDRLNKIFEEERKTYKNELDDLKRRLAIQPEFDSQQIVNKTKEKLEKANVELIQTRRELEEAKTR